MGQTESSSVEPAGDTSLRDLFDRHGGASGSLEVHRLEPLLRSLVSLQRGEATADQVHSALASVLPRVHIDSRGRVAFEELRRALIAVEQADPTTAVPTQELPKDAGHVFVLLADMRKLACDAWVRLRWRGYQGPRSNRVWAR